MGIHGTGAGVNSVSRPQHCKGQDWGPGVGRALIT